MSVAKTNPPIFDKRWRYRAPLPRPFMSFFQCLTTINTHMCVEFHDILNMLSASNHQKQISSLKRCHGNSIIDINIPFTVLHRPCFDIILMKFEANRLKIRCWIQSILKMTHFLLPVGGAITLTPNSHIYALGIIQRTKPWSLIKIRQCMWMLLDASCLSFFAINSSPRHGQTVRDIKNILAILRPQCLEIMFTEFGGNRVVIFRGVYQIPEHALFKQP